MRTGSFRCTFLLLLAALAGSADAAELAPSCTEAFHKHQYAGKAEGQTLLAVVDDRLVDAFDAVLAPRKDEHEFYYVYHNKACSEQKACSIANPIVAIKTVRVTSFPAPQVVYLSREDGAPDWHIGRSDYDQFHNADETIPPQALSRFHVTYRDPKGKKYHTHYPKERRRTYLFSGVPAEKNPWLKARNYVIEAGGGLPQCIRFTMELPRGTDSAVIEVLEIEDGGGGIPRQIQQWPLKLEPRR